MHLLVFVPFVPSVCWCVLSVYDVLCTGLEYAFTFDVGERRLDHLVFRGKGLPRKLPQAETTSCRAWRSSDFTWVPATAIELRWTLNCWFYGCKDTTFNFPDNSKVEMVCDGKRGPCYKVRMPCWGMVVESETTSNFADALHCRPIIILMNDGSGTRQGGWWWMCRRTRPVKSWGGWWWWWWISRGIRTAKCCSAGSGKGRWRFRRWRRRDTTWGDGLRSTNECWAFPPTSP